MDAKEFRKVISKSKLANPETYQSIINTNEFREYIAAYQKLLDEEMLSANTKGRANLQGAELDALLSNVRAAQIAVMATPEFKALIQ